MKHKFPFIVLCILFLGVAAFSGYKVFTILSDYKAGEDSYEELKQYVHIETEKATPKPTKKPTTDVTVIESEPIYHYDVNWPVVDFEALQKINKDVVGWIYIEGTTVNYPILQGEDNDYYLRRLIDGTYNNAGSIFMDYRNNADFSDEHTVLYGHHMNNGSMFSDILNYKKQEYFDEHPLCLILTPNGNYALELFTGYVAGTKDAAWKLVFPESGDFENWLSDAAAKSCFESRVIPTPEDKIVTLSTCSYEFNNARFVVAGVLRRAA